MSSAAQLRKIKKPLIEKRRRERMNDCLNQLKTLVLEGRNTNSNESRYSKMEKVDILEMTVRYLQDLRRSSFPACAGSPPSQSLTAKYIEGYSECASQVGQYLSSTKELSQDLRQRLSQHLVDSLRRTTAPTRLASPSGEAQAAGILSIGQTIDSRGSFQSAVSTDCAASTMLKTSIQSPAILSTKFAVLETETGTLSPSTRVIIPFYLSSTCSTSSSSSPSFIPITHASSGQILASATFQPLSASPLFNATRSTPSTPSPKIFASSGSPNLLASSTTSPTVITGSRDFHGNSVCCSSPRQGDEFPSSNNSPSTPPTVATLHIDSWRQQTVPAEKVWRPWNDYPGKMS